MQTRVKERLVGAIALVVIVVIVVPELLTGRRGAPPPPPPAAGSAPTRVVTIDLAGRERYAIDRSKPLVPTPDPAASPPPAAAAGEEAPVAASTAAAGTAPAAAASEPPPPAPVVAASPRPAPATPASHGGSAWIVQLGSFASKENAERLAAALRGKGYSAFVAEWRGSGRVLFRVRVGPEQDRARADAIAARLAREGHRGSVTPEP